MDRERLDSYERLPSGQREYLSAYGWSFSKKLCEFAVSRMSDRNGKKIEPLTREKLDQMLKTYGIQLKNDNGYDAVYVANMARADYFGSSIPNEQALVLFVRDYIDDPDGYPGLPLTRYVADCVGSGVALNWEDYL